MAADWGEALGKALDFASEASDLAEGAEHRVSFTIAVEDGHSEMLVERVFLDLGRLGPSLCRADWEDLHRTACGDEFEAGTELYDLACEEGLCVPLDRLPSGFSRLCATPDPGVREALEGMARDMDDSVRGTR